MLLVSAPTVATFIYATQKGPRFTELISVSILKTLLSFTVLLATSQDHWSAALTEVKSSAFGGRDH